jgi:hypothetical protein
MALIRKRYTSFGREDKLVGVKALLRGDSIIIRAIAFALCAGIYLLVVEVTHKKTPTENTTQDSVVTAPKK